MNTFISILCLFVIIVFLVIVRASIAQRRLQACIDNGSLLYDGALIVMPESISEEQSQQLQFEIDFYFQSKRLFRTFPNRLYKKSSYR